MSPRVRTPKVTPTVWRERLSANVADRQTFWAMRGGHFLTVTVSRVSPERLEVTGQVTGNKVQRERYRISFNEPGDPSIVIQVAKEWAEKVVDELSTKTD